MPAASQAPIIFSYGPIRIRYFRRGEEAHTLHAAAGLISDCL